ncbi:DUF881 domain-containing protein [Cellulomonas aerilata]|uniref:Membrane protein n=1 Tax=Cellulomonas aerilata TaxID=515326 RepID=A0A512DAH1_9CELL|nr:DUF881 domain-containing protein [Cellulomonas aerilata]GEO33473.1 membrane protein [Cellulomonas aerilata]
MTLINEVMHKPLDPGYAEAAERHRLEGSRRAPARQRIAVVVVAVGLGLAVTTAASSLRAPQPEATRARTLLTEQITEQGDRSAALLASNDAVSREIARLRTQALGADDPALLEELARDELAAGTASVSGPGLRLTLTDAPTAQGDTGEADPDQRVQDVDLQVVTNGLWAAGAEAIAVNGQRLTVLTAIRSAGSAILVDLAPLTGPYVVEAIGDPAAMQTAFARTAAAQHLSTLRNTYEIGSDISAQDRLELPGSSRTRLSAATVPPPAEPAEPGEPALPEQPGRSTVAPGSQPPDAVDPGQGPGPDADDGARGAAGDVASSGQSNERDLS